MCQISEGDGDDRRNMLVGAAANTATDVHVRNESTQSRTFFSQPEGSLCLAPMNFLMAGRVLPLRSFRPAMASTIIAAYVGC